MAFFYIMPGKSEKKKKGGRKKVSEFQNVLYYKGYERERAHITSPMVCVTLISHYVLSTSCKCCTPIVWDVIKPDTRVPDVQHAEWTGTKIRGSHGKGGSRSFTLSSESMAAPNTSSTPRVLTVLK